MRIALVGEGTRGDLIPLRVLAEHLVAAGITTRLISRPDFAVGNPEGVEFRAIGTPIRDFTARHAKSFRGMGPSFRRATQRYLHECLAVHFGELPAALEGCDLAIGAGMALGVPSAAEAVGIPYRVLVYCPVVFRSDDHAPVFFPAEKAPRWAKRLLWHLAEGPFDALIARELQKQRRGLGLGRLPRSPGGARATPHLLSERPTLVADRCLAPLPEAWRGQVDTLPYLMPKAEGSLPEKLEHFLEQGPPPVFFGFGSMPDGSPGKTTALLSRLVQDLGCRALVSTGWAGLGAEALPPDIAVVEDVPHTLLFPRVAGVIHHGGAGTTTAAARAGVPQLAIPHVLDQYYWGHRIHRLGLGPTPLPRARLRVGALRERVSALLEAEWLAENARQMAETLRGDFDQNEAYLSSWIDEIGKLVSI